MNPYVQRDESTHVDSTRPSIPQRVGGSNNLGSQTIQQIGSVPTVYLWKGHDMLPELGLILT